MSLKLPVKAGLGVLLGVLGLDWLIFGHADLVPALGLALVVGIGLVFWLRRHPSGKERSPRISKF